MDAGRHPQITLLTHSEVEEVSGYVGSFKVRIRKRARSVKEDLCTGCGLCTSVCTTGAINLVDGLARVDQSLCRECEACLLACPSDAILSLEQADVAQGPTLARVPAPGPVPVRSAAPALRLGGAFRPWVGRPLAFFGREEVPWMSALLGDLRQRSRIEGLPYSGVGIPSARIRGGRGGIRRVRRRRRARFLRRRQSDHWLESRRRQRSMANPEACRT